jgi:hypothetical protein
MLSVMAVPAGICLPFRVDERTTYAPCRTVPRAVAEGRLALAGGEIADPAGVVHAAEAEDRLLRDRRFDDHPGLRRGRWRHRRHRQRGACRQQ